MEDGRLWGVLGILLAVVGLVVLAPEMLHALGSSEGGTGTILFGVYGLGVVVAVVVTVAVIGPDLRSRV
jgi:hypothetical protein